MRYLALVVFLLPCAAAATTYQQRPVLTVPVPTIQLSNMTVTNEAGTEVLSVPWIGQYASGVYSYAVTIAGLLAGVMIVVGGFQYLTAGGDNNRVTKAKERIKDALVGLLLVFGAYLILVTVNPNLVAFDNLRVRTVKGIRFGLPDDFPEPETIATMPPPSGSGPVAGRGTVMPMVSRRSPGFDNYISFNSENMAALEAAAAGLQAATSSQPWGPGRVRGGGERSLADQMRFFTARCVAGQLPGTVISDGRERCTVPTCNPFGRTAFGTAPAGHTGRWLIASPTPEPTNCPHTSGMALDISCQTSTSAIGGIHVPCHLELERQMKLQGFCRLQTEPWHFEKPKLSSNCDFNWTPGTYCETSTRPNTPCVVHHYDSCTGWYSSYDRSVTDDSARCSPTAPRRH